MPELPDVTLYVEALQRKLVGETLEAAHIHSLFVLRSVEPPIQAFVNRKVTGTRRIGKRIVLEFEDEHFLVFHLMIAGRLRWREREKVAYKRILLAHFDFPNGTLLFTEAGTKKRAKLHGVLGEKALAEHDPGGIEPLEVDLAGFTKRLTEKNHTLKRALSDPKKFSGIGNAYSDEILHRARLSPLKWTQKLDPEEIERLHRATRETLELWIERLRADLGQAFPEKVTAFREGMAVHGRHKEPCPDCGAPVQRIVYSQNETNYCARCQTGGRVLADRALSRLLKDDWPRTLEDWER